MKNNRETGPAFPQIAARSLTGRTYALPRDFEGELNIAVIAFARWHQSLVDDWFTLLDRLAAERAGLRAYELPVIASRYSLARPFIDGGMVAGIQSRAVRERTLTIYTDVGRFTAALQILTTETVTVLLVDREGRVSWRSAGPFEVEKGDSLERALTP